MGTLPSRRAPQEMWRLRGQITAVNQGERYEGERSKEVAQTERRRPVVSQAPPDTSGSWWLLGGSEASPSEDGGRSLLEEREEKPSE